MRRRHGSWQAGLKAAASVLMAKRGALMSEAAAALHPRPRHVVLPAVEEVLDGEWVVRGAERFEEGVHVLLGHRGRDRHRAAMIAAIARPKVGLLVPARRAPRRARRTRNATSLLTQRLPRRPVGCDILTYPQLEVRHQLR